MTNREIITRHFKNLRLGKLMLSTWDCLSQLDGVWVLEGASLNMDYTGAASIVLVYNGRVSLAYGVEALQAKIKHEQQQ